MGERANSVGSGGALLGIAKFYFLIASYATVLALTRLVDPSTFGSYSAVGRLIAVPNMVIIYTLMFTVSRPMAAEYLRGTPSYDAIRGRGFKLAATLGGVVSLVFFLGAPWFAEALSEPSLAGPIRAVAPISLVYALYAVNVGSINARRAFPRQAGLDVFMATMKATLIVSAAALGLGLAATLGGFTVASLLALSLSALWVRRVRPVVSPESTGSSASPPMLELAGALIVFTLLTNMLLSVDLFVLKHFAVNDVQRAAVGYYSGAQYVSQVPYSLLNAMSLLLFPLIATLHAEAREEEIRRYVTRAARVTLVMLCLMSTVAASAASGVLELLFPSTYLQASTELRLLVIGYSGYSLTVTVAWMLNSSERTRVAVCIVVIPLVLAAVGAWLGAASLGSVGVAGAVFCAGAVAVVVSLLALRLIFGAGLGWAWSLRLAATVASTAGAGSLWTPSGTLEILGKLFALTIVFGAVGVAIRVVSVAELKELRARV